MTPSDKASPPQRIVRCPNCGGDSVYAPSNAYRPFCGERCKMADLGAWATESYRVPAAPPPEGDEQELSDDPLDTYRAPPPLH